MAEDKKITIGIENLGERLEPYFPDQSDANILFEIAQDLVDSGHSNAEVKKILKDQYNATTDEVKAVTEKVLKSEVEHSSKASTINLIKKALQVSHEDVRSLDEKYDGKLGEGAMAHAFISEMLGSLVQEWSKEDYIKMVTSREREYAPPGFRPDELEAIGNLYDEVIKVHTASTDKKADDSKTNFLLENSEDLKASIEYLNEIAATREAWESSLDSEEKYREAFSRMEMFDDNVFEAIDRWTLNRRPGIDSIVEFAFENYYRYGTEPYNIILAIDTFYHITEKLISESGAGAASTKEYLSNKVYRASNLIK